MQIIKCAYCFHENRVHSSRIVFCERCDRKLQNNFIDWSKEKQDSTFEKYVNELGEYNSNFQHTYIDSKIDDKATPVISEISKGFKKNRNYYSLAFVIAIVIVIITIKFNSVNSVKPNWTKISIDNKFTVYSPFPIYEAESLLPLFFNYYTGKESSRKVAIPEYFSFSLDEIDLTETSINSNDLISIDDNYINKSDVLWKDEKDICQFSIKNYKVYLRTSEITFNEKNYYYDNYTFIKKNKCIKIIIHTLKNNDTTELFRDKIINSILINKN